MVSKVKKGRQSGGKSLIPTRKTAKKPPLIRQSKPPKDAASTFINAPGINGGNAQRLMDKR